VATAAVVILGYLLGISHLEWCAIALACAAVWTAEALNTAIEFLSDATTREIDPLVGKAKDVAAGAVLIAAVAAVIVGLLVFVPYFRVLLMSMGFERTSFHP
jgi:diacylglycerol kinase (ATP)